MKTSVTVQLTCIEIAGNDNKICRNQILMAHKYSVKFLRIVIWNTQSVPRYVH